MPDPLTEEPTLRAFETLLRLLDACAWMDTHRPVYRSLTTAQIRQIIADGLGDE